MNRLDSLDRPQIPEQLKEWENALVGSYYAVRFSIAKKQLAALVPTVGSRTSAQLNIPLVNLLEDSRHVFADFARSNSHQLQTQDIGQAIHNLGFPPEGYTLQRSIFCALMSSGQGGIKSYDIRALGISVPRYPSSLNSTTSAQTAREHAVSVTGYLGSLRIFTEIRPIIVR